MKRIAATFFTFYLFLSMLVNFTGCASGLMLEGLAAEEVVGLGRAALITEEYGLAVRGSTLLVAEEDIFFSNLRRVRIEPPSTLKPSRLYVTENGTNSYFGIAEDGKSIKLIDYLDRTIELPKGSSLFRVRQNANIRVGPGKEYAIYKFNGQNLPPLLENHVVLVLRRIGNWYEIQISRAETGYIFAPLLATAVFVNDHNKSSSRFACDICKARGFVYKDLKCSKCNGSTQTFCSECNGKGKFVCQDCHGDTKFICPDCHGDTKFICPDCKGKGIIINSQGLQKCYKCYQSGYIPCYKCYQSGYIPCYKCYQSGTTPCYKCYKTGFLKCDFCNGSGTRTEKYQCSKCDGSGFVENISYKENDNLKNTLRRLSYIDEFNDNKHNWKTNYFTENFSCNIINGKYILENKSQLDFYSFGEVPLDLTSDYGISISARHVSGILSYGYGLLFSFKDKDNYYKFEIAEGNYRLIRLKNGIYEGLVPWTASSEINKASEVNILSIKKRCSNISLFINNVYVNKVYGFLEFGNKLGFIVEDNQTIEFDSLIVDQ